jgi:predicted dehydrogenase
MDPIRVALIGFGYVGRVFHAPLISAVPGLVLSVIGSRQEAAARSAHPAAEIVPDPFGAVRHRDADLVVIATPNDTHAPLAEAALRAGKHVVVDKPFTLTLAEARALAALSAEAGRYLSVFQNRRFDSDFLALRQAIESGRLGDVVEVRSEISRWRPQIRDRWRERGGPGAGIWYDLGPHLADQALVLFGPPDTVSADLQIQRAGASAHDWFQAILGYGPRRVILEASMLAADTAPRFLARATKGCMLKRRGDVQESQLIAGEAPGSPGWGCDPDAAVFVTEGNPPQELETPPGDYRRYYAAIRDAIRGAGALPVTPTQATALMAVIEAGLRSADSGRTVIPDITDAERAAWEPPRPA